MVSRRRRAQSTLGMQITDLVQTTADLEQKAGSTPPADSVDGGSIKENGITKRELAPNSVGTEQLEPASVGSKELGSLGEIKTDSWISLFGPNYTGTGSLSRDADGRIVLGGGGASVVVSATAPGSPSEGDLWWNEDDGKLYIYYTDGTSDQWVEITSSSAFGSLPVGAIIDYPIDAPLPGYALECQGGTASRTIFGSLFGVVGTDFGPGDGSTTFGLPDLPTFDGGGLIPVHPAGLTTSGGTATAADDGKITYTGVNSVSLDGIFTGEFLNYLVVWNNESSSADAAVTVRFRTAGTDDTTGYANGYAETTGASWSFSSPTTEARVGRTASAGGSGDFQVFNPYQSSEVTRLRGGSMDNSGFNAVAGARYSTTKTHDGLTFVAGSTATGTIEVYGIRGGETLTRKIIIATDQGSGVTVIQGGEGYTLGQVVDWPTGTAIPANHLAFDQTVSASTYSGLAALFPSWVSGSDLILPRNPSPRPLIGSAYRADSATLLTTGYVDVASLTLTAESDGGVVYISGDVVFENANSGADRLVHFKVLCDGALVEEWTPFNLPINGNSRYAISFATQHTPTAASHTWKIQAYCTTGSAVYVRSGTMRVEGTPITQKIICAADSAGEYSPTVQAALTAQSIDHGERIDNLEYRVQGVLPSSVVVGSGSATVADDGMVTITGCTSFSLNGVFDGLGGDCYRIIGVLNGAAEVSGFKAIRLRSAGTDRTTGYYQHYVYGLSTSWASFSISGSAQNNGAYFGIGYRRYTSFDVLVKHPGVASIETEYAGLIGSDGSNQVAGPTWGRKTPDANDGFTVYNGATTAMTGWIKVVKVA